MHELGHAYNNVNEINIPARFVAGRGDILVTNKISAKNCNVFNDFGTIQKKRLQIFLWHGHMGFGRNTSRKCRSRLDDSSDEW